jgi:hypothetical protein
MFGLGDSGLRRQKRHFNEVLARLEDLESRADLTETKRLWAHVWQDHPEEGEFYIKLAKAREVMDLSAQQLRTAKSEIPNFDRDLDLVDHALRECQQYIENLLMTLMSRQMMGGGPPQASAD